MRGQQPQVTVYRTPVRSAAPQAIWIARALGWLYGKAIKGDNGAVRYGYPGLDTNRTSYKGYVFPPQIFTGYDPGKVAAGFIRPDPASLPGDSTAPAAARSPLARAMHAVTVSQQAQS
jgi:hypothetical protein